ncbi:PcfJ domain-containing protein [Pararhizobium sp. BT-229]|uniref:PcfJ domain-containing protein n=1 Tax=Pararhizobium sp. BT-229 TaxID=2986923 RepID=UPI0021F6F930|nr:PcfJ domain-containing protein [Pararhizobium sp. BT-229]MCV9964149.1 PcfJ domain-containing protein [Pararhizobium sp. BT-229]
MGADNPRYVAITEYLNQKAHGNERVAELLWHSVGRVWLKDSGDFLSYDIARIGMITHIADWLKVSVLDDAPWLAKVDDQGRPKKLLKFGTLEAIHAEADRQMRRKQERQAAADLLSEDDEVLHYDLGGGWRIVRMLSARALDRESELMQHCIGHGGYDDDLSKDGTLLLSLRDPRGKPHATIEIEDGELVQFQGKQNRVPLEKYIDRCLPFLRSAGVECNNTGILVTDVGGTVYSIFDLPDTLTVKGDLTIQSKGDRLVRLPKEIVAEGNLTIRSLSCDPGFSNAPEVLHVCGNLVMSGERIKELPASIKVGGSIRLDHSGISQLPANLSVAGFLSMRRTPLRTLPPGLRVERKLDLYKTDVDEIPGDLRCGSIDISGTDVRRFDTSVFLEESTDGDFRMLVARDACLEEIVGDPTFYSLDIAGTKVRTLPHGLAVAENLIIASTPIRELPAEVRIGGSIDASECDITIALSEVARNVELTNSKVSFPAVFRCGGMLKLSGAAVVKMPRFVHAGIFRMSCGTADSFPEHVEAELVDVSGFAECRLVGTVKARKLRISGDIAVIGKGVNAVDVEVSVELFHVYCASLKDVREHLERHGNLKRPPKNARVIPYGMGGIGSGKTSFMSGVWRELTGRRRGPAVVAYEQPMPFVLDCEMPSSVVWETDGLPFTR